ncbi:MAG: hypothetical protein K2M64_00270 [Clostridia bacterium]|nr:hypothetical protein [Clostridia bacterium]
MGASPRGSNPSASAKIGKFRKEFADFTYCIRKAGGTKSTIDYAKQQGLEIIIIQP